MLGKLLRTVNRLFSLPESMAHPGPKNHKAGIQLRRLEPLNASRKYAIKTRLPIEMMLLYYYVDGRSRRRQGSPWISLYLAHLRPRLGSIPASQYNLL